MRVLLTSEARFERTPDGLVWGPAAYGRALWARYLEVFSSVMIAGRVADVDRVSEGYVEASTAAIEFCALPAYSGFGGVLQSLSSVRRRLSAAVRTSPAVVVRAPSPLAYFASRAVADLRRRFAAEVVGDPDQVFAPGAFRHPLRAPIRSVATAAQRRLCREACAVLYVTRGALQRFYPTGGRSYAASDVALDDAAFASPPSRVWMRDSNFVLVTVGSLDQPYKGTSVLIEAVGELRRDGVPVRLRIVGSGRLRDELRQQCARLHIADDVEFVGPQDRDGVREALDSAHLFVLPSLTEGLPRALLEAMARGLPAVGSDVGGVPELLPAECLVPPREPRALGARIRELIEDEYARRRLGEANRRKARTYHDSVQHAIRKDFLQFVRAVSAATDREVRCA